MDEHVHRPGEIESWWYPLRARCGRTRPEPTTSKDRDPPVRTPARGTLTEDDGDLEAVVERRTADRLRGATRGAADDDAAGPQGPGDRPQDVSTPSDRATGGAPAAQRGPSDAYSEGPSLLAGTVSTGETGAAVGTRSTDTDGLAPGPSV